MICLSFFSIFSTVQSSQVSIHQLIKPTKLDELLWCFDATTLYPSAMWDESSIYLRIETGYAYTEDMNKELVEKINNQSFAQGSAILKTKLYNQKNYSFNIFLFKREKIKMKLIV